MNRDPRVRVSLNKAWLLRVLDACLKDETLDALRERIAKVQASLDDVIPSGKETLTFKRAVLLEDLQQILEARTLQRAKYYVRRLRRGAVEVRTNAVNDINLNRWKAYDEVLTDSLWVIEKRDSSGGHHAGYWGNFIPQIPRQMMWRYTKRGEWVLDPFVGSGTTLIECLRLGRHGIGIELNPETARQAQAVLDEEPNPFDVTTEVRVGDSTAIDYGAILAANDVKEIALAILHPPYHDIIPFSDDPRDLSNTGSVEQFVDRFTQVVQGVTPILGAGRYLVVVIGDKYVKGEWISLGFYAMQAVMQAGYTLKSIVVKNFEETRAKRHQKALWRYRALQGGFYIFKHEYIFVFQK
jgi:DNA modification methylase